jgi:hypothetical protein
VVRSRDLPRSARLAMTTISTVSICDFGYCVTTLLFATSGSAPAASRPGTQHGTVEDLARQLAER